MTFIIRQVTKRANGQELVRDRMVDKSSITVGRATGNDLFLTDLRVGLEHLTISVSGTRLSVEALGDKNFVVGGRAVSTLTVSDKKGRAIEVGPYSLALSRGDDDRWVVEVRREEPEEQLDEDQVDELFSLRGSSLGKRSPALIGFSVVAALFVLLPIAWFFGMVPDSVDKHFDADGAWLSGPLSGGHANLEGDCQACHVNAFEHVTDATCIDCHEGLINHAEPVRLTSAMATPAGFDGFLTQTATMFGKEPGECADCHREHNGEEGIVLEASSLCTDCHVDMSTRLADTELIDAGDFGTNHGNFHAVVVADPGPPAAYGRYSLDDPQLADNSGLKFPHDIHLEATGPVANQAQALSSEFGFGAALDCADCHKPETGGLLFETVTMEGSCQMCHSLVFEKDGSVERKLPHGEPQEVVAILQEFYRSQALGRAVAPVTTSRRRPGGTSQLRQVDRRDTGLIEADQNARLMVTRVFSEGGTCYDCHEVIPAPEGTVDFDILPVTLVDQFMTKSVFNHEKHEVGDLSCGSCHEAEASGDASHVLLPGIETRIGALSGEEVIGCRDCHGGEKAGGDLIASTCIDCHGYHDGTHAPVMTASDGKPETMAFNPARWGRIPSEESMQ